MGQDTSFERLLESRPTLSISILSADLTSLGTEVSSLERTDSELLHFDVMDGHFAPMMTLGPPLIKAVRTSLLKDLHLMIDDPLDRVDAYVAAGADMVTVHAESGGHLHRVLQRLGELPNRNDPVRGLIRGIALNPGTPLEAIEPVLDQVELILLLAINPGWSGQSFLPSTFARIDRTRAMIATAGRDILISVDGGIKRANIADVAKAGADIVVTGSAVFDGKAPADNIRFMLDALRSYRA